MTMTAIWDDSRRVIERSSGALTMLAVLLLWVPGALSGIAELYASSTDPVIAAAAGIAGFVAGVMVLWGGLAITALALQDRDEGGVAGRPAARTAAGAGARALPRMVLVVLLLLVLVGLALLPLVGILAGAGVDIAAFGGSGPAPTIPPAAGFAVFAYLLVVAPVALVLAARVALLSPVVVAEGRIAGAFRRSWRLTRGLTIRLIGLIVVFAFVALVLMGAVRFVAGTLLLLAFGDGTPVNLATILIAILTAGASALVITVSSVFVARLYRRVAGAPSGAEAAVAAS